MRARKRVDGRYERVGELADRGVMDLIDPLDYIILDALPTEGTTAGGFYPIGSSIRSLLPKFDGHLTSTEVSARVRVMRLMGLTKRVTMPGTSNKGKGWQRTQRAEEVLKKWRQKQQSKVAKS